MSIQSALRTLQQVTKPGAISVPEQNSFPINNSASTVVSMFDRSDFRGITFEPASPRVNHLSNHARIFAFGFVHRAEWRVMHTFLCCRLIMTSAAPMIMTLHTGATAY